MPRSVVTDFSDTACLLSATCGVPERHTTNECNIAHNRWPGWTRLPHAPAAAWLVFLPVARHGHGATGHLIYFPRGIPAKRTTIILSSRLSRRLENYASWFRALRSACSEIAYQDELMVNVVGTTTSRFTPRATELFGTSRMDVHLCATRSKKSITPSQWWQQVATPAMESANDASGTVLQAYVSPPIRISRFPESPRRSQSRRDAPSFGSDALLASPFPPHGHATADSFHQQPPEPLADFLAEQLAGRIYALHVRAQSTTHRILLCRLAKENQSPSRRPSIRLAIGHGLHDRATQQQLLAAGVLGWYLYPSEPSSTGQNDHCENEPVSRRKANRRTLRASATLAIPPTDEGDPYLTHCTRRRHGPWPDQSRRSYLDDLILQRPGADHSALASLKRIVSAAQIQGSHAAIHGATAVVSLTSVPLPELQALRVFRPHRGHWDFEPYGVCILRSALKDLAERSDVRFGPVVYVDQHVWDASGREERLFFHKAHSITRSGNAIDWTTEQEWRYAGNIDLSALTADKAFVFVPTESEASELRPESPWPVIALNSSG